MRSTQRVFQLEPEAEAERSQVRQLLGDGVRLVGVTSDGRQVALGGVVEQVLRAAVSGLAEGGPVVVAEGGGALSPTEASKVLGVSRPTITRWITEGLLVDEPVGAHHRIPVESVLQLRDARVEAGYQAMRLLEQVEKEPEIAARVEAARERARSRIAQRSAG